MGGDFNLIEFYPINGQSSMFRSMHPGVLHTTIGHYGLGFTFIFSMNLFFIYIYKTISYQRVDIRGTKATGEKRRLAGPEMLVVIIPFYGAINIVTNALAYLRILEGNCGHVILTAQVNGFQGGGKYCYSDIFYSKYFDNPDKIGKNGEFNADGSVYHPNRTIRGDASYAICLSKFTIEYDIGDTHYIKERYYDIPEENEKLRGSGDLFDKDDTELDIEVFYNRNGMKTVGVIENELKNKSKNKKGQHGFGLTAQGLDSNNSYYSQLETESDDGIKVQLDPLRLLRSSGALVLPTKYTVRLMGCSDDITHSGAVPGLGFKMDCVPGRLFSLYLNIIRDGIYYGQCSELCGGNHYNMPIVVYALPLDHFLVGGEIELHLIFKKEFYNFDKSFSEENVDYITYKLLDYKFK